MGHRFQHGKSEALFERWKQQQTLEQLYQKYRDPLSVSGAELASRLHEVVSEYPTVFLVTNVLECRPQKQVHNSVDDAYFQRYKLVSTTYRICAFLGWLELYRQELTHLHPERDAHSRALECAVAHIREDFADGTLNTADDWTEWRDTLVFREELRAIGESMIEERNSVRTILGYGRFSELLDSSDPSPTQRWARVVLNFLLDLEPERSDFRRTRLQRLFVHVVRFTQLLDPSFDREDLLSAAKNIGQGLRI